MTFLHSICNINIDHMSRTQDHFASVTVHHLSGLMHMTCKVHVNDNQWDFIRIGKMYQSIQQHSDKVGQLITMGKATR